VSGYLFVSQDADWSTHLRSLVGDGEEFGTTSCVESPTFEDTVRVVERVDPAVVIVGPDIGSDAGLGIARAVDEHMPDTTVVLMTDPNPQLLERAVRSGVRDVIDPLAGDEFVAVALKDALASATRRRSRFRSTSEPEPRRAKVVTVVSPKGGAGKTATTERGCGRRPRPPVR
jgi:pilus assembly protein CpaE